MFNLYEIYVRNSLTGEGGWDIGHVVALSEEDAATVPNFDCVIMKDGTFSDCKLSAANSGYSMTEAVHNMIYG